MANKKELLKPVAEVFKFPKRLSALQVLQAGREILSDEDRWVQSAEMTYYDDNSVAEFNSGSCKLYDVEICDNEAIPRYAPAIQFCAIGVVRWLDGPAEKKAQDLLEIASLVVKKQVKLYPDGELSLTKEGLERFDIDGKEFAKGKPILQKRLLDLVCAEEITSLNDKLGYKAVLKMFDIAIKLATPKQKLPINESTPITQA